jgi:hypothetical protein
MKKKPYYYTFTFHIIIIGIKFLRATQKLGRHIRPVLPAVQVSLWTFPENPLVRHSCNYKTHHKMCHAGWLWSDDKVIHRVEIGLLRLNKNQMHTQPHRVCSHPYLNQ